MALKGPYGKAEEISVYVQQADGTEKEFTDIEGGYTIDVTLNRVGTFSVSMDGLEEADKAYIAINTTALIFANMRLVMAGRINSVEYGNEGAVTFSGEQIAVSKLMDHSTASLTFTNVDSNTINSCLLCTPGTNIISAGTNTNFGKISYRNENDNVANALNKVAGAVSFDWWTADGGASCQCYTPSASCSGVYTQPGVKLIDDGDSVYNWAAGAGACAVALATSNKREGYASLAMGGEGACTDFCYTKTIQSGDTIIPFENFQWWFYVKDVTKLHATNPVRVCLYQASDSEGYYVDIACADLSNGWNLIGKNKTTHFTPNASVGAAYTAIDTARVVIKPSNTGNMASGDLALDWFTNYEYGTQYFNTDTAKGCATQVINDAEATTCWTAECVGDSVAAISTPTPKCGTNGITFIKAQTGATSSCYSVLFPAGECFRNMKSKYFGFWFYLDCATCASLPSTTPPLKIRVGDSLPATTYKEYCWQCKDLTCGWQLLMADMKFPESITDAANLNEVATDCMTFVLDTCAAACTLASGKIVVDQVVNSVYGLNYNGKNTNAEGISNESDANSLANIVTVLGAGDGINQLCTNTLGATCDRNCLKDGESFLSADLAAATTDHLCVYDTTGYKATSGTVCIDGECIGYGTKNATCLITLTRGAGSGTACQLHVCNSSVKTLDYLEVVDITGFPSPSGNICIGRENIAYTGITANCFTGLTRGASSTNCYAHSKNIEVYDAQHTEATCQACSSIACFGTRSITINCPNIIDQNLLDRTSQTVFANNCCPPKRIIGRAMEPNFLERTWVGDTILLNDESSSTQGPFRLVRVKPMYSTDEGIGYEFELSNKKVGMVEELQKKSDQINEQGQYMQGATNVYQLTGEENTDTGKGLCMKFFMPHDTKAINCMKLSYDVDSYRTYHSATDSCGAGTNYFDGVSLDVPSDVANFGVVLSSIAGPLDSATFVRHIWGGGYQNRSGATQTDYHMCIFEGNVSSKTSIYTSGALTLADGEGAFFNVIDTVNSVGAACITMCNEAGYQNDEFKFSYITEGTHTHTVDYGITDTSSTVSAVCILVNGTDCTACFGTPSTTQETSLDLLPIASILTPGQFHSIEIRPTGRGRIRANLYTKVYIESAK